MALSATTFAQTGIGTTTPNASAQLDVSSTTKGFLPPRVALTSTNSASPLAAHVAGMVVYNTATVSDVTPGLYVNTGAVWEKQVGATNINGLIDAKTDAESIFLGGGAGFQDNGLNSNTGVGINTLYSVTSGADNVGIGYQASPHTQTTSNNTVIGSNANKLNFGSDNVSVGSYAGYQANGSGNVLLGNHAGYFSSSSTLNNKLYIENSASATPLIYGEFDTNLARINGNFEVTGTVNVGTGGDLEIYHDGSVSSYVKAPTGVLNLQSNDLRLGAANGESYLRGSANTDEIISVLGTNEEPYAAWIARAYTGGSYTDWFLPSADELHQMYLNRVTINTSAEANGGSIFSTTECCGTTQPYWSSTDYDNFDAWSQYFGDGTQDSNFKGSPDYVRAVRAF